METVNDSILNYIHRRFPLDSNWMNGNCLQFALLLHNRFPQYYICYLPVDGHFVVCDGGDHYYDWEGRHPVGNQTLLLLDAIKDSDPLWYSHLMRDCWE